MEWCEVPAVTKALVEHDRRVPEAGLEVAVRPLVVDLSHRQLAVGRGGEVGVGPLDLGDALAAHHRVAVQAGVGAVRPQALERVEHERERLEVQLDLPDRVLCDRLVHRGQRGDRLAHEVRRVGEDGVARRGDLGHVVVGQDRDHTFHRERRRGVDASHARMRHGKRTGYLRKLLISTATGPPAEAMLSASANVPGS